MAVREGAPGPAQELQNHANAIGASKIKLDSTWWGSEKFGVWSEEWWVEIDHETEDAIHISGYSDSRHPSTERLASGDVWLPKSKVDIIVEPQWKPTALPDGESKGTLRVGASFKTRYGVKRKITGDTYEAFKEDALADELPWDKTHATFNGDEWEIDSTEEALSLLREKATDAGYEIEEIRQGGWGRGTPVSCIAIADRS